MAAKGKEILVTGATGFVGGHLVRALLDAGFRVRALVRPAGTVPPWWASRGVTPCRGELPDNLGPACLEGCDAVIHLVGIIREFPSRGITFQRLHVDAVRAVLDAAAQAGLTRFVHMSALGAGPLAGSSYHRTKYAAEQMVAAGGLEWTVFRPSVIFGPGDSFLSLLRRLLRWSPVFPVPGPGASRLQPVHVQDVAAAFAGCLEKKETVGRIYGLCGPRAWSLDELIDLVARYTFWRRTWKIHLPLSVVRPWVRLLERVPAFPLTYDQLHMLSSDNLCEDTAVWDLLKIFPAGLESFMSS